VTCEILRIRIRHEVIVLAESSEYEAIPAFSMINDEGSGS
jgi:hypothetical protein